MFGFSRRAPPAPAAPAEPIDVRRLVAASGLFDAAFYLETNPDVAASGIEPLAHFCVNGWREGRRPNLYFDPAWYAATHKLPRGEGTAVANAAGCEQDNPLVHYILSGEARGTRPAASFDPLWYRRVADVPSGASPLAHLLAHRAAQGFGAQQPSDFGFWDDRAAIVASGLFEHDVYLIANPDVREAGRDPIFHFHANGWREGRQPNLYFDPLWYHARYLADRPEANPLAHYVRGGEKAGCRPSCLFDPEWYRRTYRVPANRLALAHFLEHRRSQRVAPNPHFDLAFYLGRHGEEVGLNRDPFAHLLRWGATRDLDPSPAFDTAAYRREAMAGREDASGQIPLVHYLDALSRSRSSTATASAR